MSGAMQNNDAKACLLFACMFVQLSLSPMIPVRRRVVRSIRMLSNLLSDILSKSEIANQAQRLQSRCTRYSPHF